MIYDSLGKLVYSDAILNSSEAIIIENLEKGIYFLQMNINEQLYSKKFIKL